ncbi:MAG: PhoH family protein [Clostridia bacterium]|nr:PhoH family protein [Clostridia bacterium]
MMEQILNLDNIDIVMSVFGSFDSNVKIIENNYGISIVNRGPDIKVSGPPEAVEAGIKVLSALAEIASRGETITEQHVHYSISMVDEGNEQLLKDLGTDNICITAKGRPIKPKTLGQKEYVKAISSSTITLGIGPAGTGKTYLAVAMAVTALRNKQINRIILTRPAVEAGEKLGFLPGDLQTKVDPYLRPLYDALYEMLGIETFQRYMEKNVIEIAPLAYMRGRTLDDSFIILDEAQNTTGEQMKMFLTRLGFNSKIIITGDITQIDLPSDKKSGLKEAQRILRNIEDISICTLSYKDVVRHRLVQQIIKAYEAADANREARERKITARKKFILKKTGKNQ